MKLRTAARPPLPSYFDVVIVGGGIHGIALARQLALAGRSTLLLEQHDFASGSTSRASRIIGDVFCDLERGDFAAVRESLRERNRLLVERGHLVRPISGVAALGPDRRRSALEVRLGLWLRRKLQTAPGERSGDFLLARVKHLLEHRAEWSLLGFDDAICEFPQRLAAEWLREAQEAGAVARNYSRVLHLHAERNVICGVIVRDLPSDSECFVRTRWVINATGASVNTFAQMAGCRDSLDYSTARTTHLVLRRFRGAPDASVYTEGVDGNPVVLHPWNGQYLFGSTQVADKSLLAPQQPTDAEIEYLYRSLLKLFPHLDIDVTAAFAETCIAPADRGLGLRLMGNRTQVVDHAKHGVAGLISIIGGSVTTAASAAEECARTIDFRIASSAACEYLPGRANGIEAALQQWAHTVAGLAHIPPESARAIAAWHGRRALCIARLASLSERLRKPLCPHTPHITAEAVDAFRYESALVLGDVLLRRVPVALSDCWSGECTQVAAQRIGAVMGWTETDIQEQIVQFDMERSDLLVKPRPRIPASLRPDSLAA